MRGCGSCKGGRGGDTIGLWQWCKMQGRVIFSSLLSKKIVTGKSNKWHEKLTNCVVKFPVGHHRFELCGSGR